MQMIVNVSVAGGESCFESNVKVLTFPERVLGKAGVMMMSSGMANAPTCLRTSFLNSLISSGEEASPYLQIT